MKFLLALIVVIPTLIAVLLFAVAGLSFNAPEMLAAAANPAIAICCIIAGVVALVPLIAASAILIVNLISVSKKKKSETKQQKQDI